MGGKGSGKKEDGKRSEGEGKAKKSKKSLQEIFGFEDGFEVSNVTGAGWALIGGGLFVLAAFFFMLCRSSCCLCSPSSGIDRQRSIAPRLTERASVASAGSKADVLPRFIAFG